MRLLTDEYLQSIKIKIYNPFKYSLDDEYLRNYNQLDGLREIAKAQAKLTRKGIAEDLETFICDECSTPNFVNIVLPKEKWQALKGS